MDLSTATDRLRRFVFEVWSQAWYGSKEAPLSHRELYWLRWMMGRLNQFPTMRALVVDSVCQTSGTGSMTVLWDRNGGIVFDGTEQVVVYPLDAHYAGKPVHVNERYGYAETDAVWFDAPMPGKQEHIRKTVEGFRIDLVPWRDSALGAMHWPLPGPWNFILRRWLRDCERALSMLVRNQVGSRKEDARAAAERCR